MHEHFHAIVWIDHREAKVFRSSTPEAGPIVVQAHGTGHHLQHRAHIPGSGHQGVDKEFFGRVIEALNDADAILLTGPGNTRMELKNYMAESRKDLAARIRAVEPLDHPSDGQLRALARKFFQAAEHTLPQAG